MRCNAILIFIVIFSIFSSCKKKDTDTPKPEPEQLKGVFLAGVEHNYLKHIDQATYWVNGVSSHLSEGRNSIVKSITLDGTDIYVAGAIETKDGNWRAVYWKNGTLIPLVDTARHSESYNLNSIATKIAIHNKEVYVVGVSGDQGVPYAALWRNGKFENLSSGYIDGIGYSIGFSLSGDTYIVGYVVGDDHYMSPRVWKNGVLQPPIDGLISYNAISVFGNDVYVAGRGYGHDDHEKATILKNGQLYLQLEGSTDATDIVVNETGYYVSGQSYWTSNAMYWSNGKEMELAGGVTTGIAVDGTDVYVIGNDLGRWNGTCWKNGQPLPLSDSTESIEINAIAIRR